MASVNTLCKSVLNVKNTVIKNCNLYSDKNGTTAHSAINHALFMINIPVV